VRFVIGVTIVIVTVASAPAGENLILEVSGSFEAMSLSDGPPALALYDVEIPSRGFFRSEVVASPGVPNDPGFVWSAQLNRVGDVNLGNFTTTPLDQPPITTMRSGLLPDPGHLPATVTGAYRASALDGFPIVGYAQDFTARGFFDPSPVADAGPTVLIESGTSGVLLGGGSDVDGDPMTFQWTLIQGPNLGLSDSAAAQPTFTAPSLTAPDTTRMQLVASDANSASLPVTVDVLIYPPGGNIPPLVNAGPGDVGDFFTTLSLDGTMSSDFDGAVTLFSWTQIGGPRVEPSDPASANPTFKQYDPFRFDRSYTFELAVSDGLDISASDSVSFTVTGYATAEVPLGPNETLIFNGMGSVPEVTQASGNPPETVDFAGINVTGPGRLRTEVLGSPGLFGGPDGNNPNFHLSSHGSAWDGFGTFDFQQTDIEAPPIIANTFFNDATGGARTLTVIGPQALSFTFLDFLFGDAQSFDVNVWFRPASAPPVADAGSPQSAEGGRAVQLDGRGSTDPDGNPLSLQWTQTAGPGVRLSNANSPVPLFKAPTVSSPVTLEFTLVVSDGQMSEPSTTTVTVTPATSGPRIAAATVVEQGALDLTLMPGDKFLLTFDQPVTATPAVIQDADWFLTTAGTTFGFSSTIAPSPVDPKTLIITLGSSASGFLIPGDTPETSTGIDIAAGNTLGIVNPRTDAPAVDGGLPGVDDVAIDLRWQYAGIPATVGPAGGDVGVETNAVAYELTRPLLSIPAGALGAPAQFDFQVLPQTIAALGLPTAVRIETDAVDPLNLFAEPATLTLEYRDFDVDFEAGQVEGLVRPFQLADTGPLPLGAGSRGPSDPRPIRSAVDQNAAENTVTVRLDGLSPAGAGEIGVFATLPINPVEERSIIIKPTTGMSGARLSVATPLGPGGPALAPGDGSGYLLHVLEFPNHVETDPADPERIQVTVRSATLFDRVATDPGANSFPTQSGAVFVVETRGPTGAPLHFTDPVNQTVQFIVRNDPMLTDVVDFDGVLGQPGQMRIVRSRVGSLLGADYQFIADAQTLDVVARVISASGVTPLTDANGQAAWGAVVDVNVTPITVDEIVDHLLGVSPLTGSRLSQGDINGDGAVDSADVVKLIGP
jgi:hypothetical protein